jgi:HPt (histidine-containing phosphotransfer) domain-containing protein
LPRPLPEARSRARRSRSAALRELTGGDAEFERELVDTFVEQRRSMPGRDRRGAAVSDFDTIGKRAHALKGASANIHAPALSTAASSLESAARANSVREPSMNWWCGAGEKLRAVNAQLRKAG